MAAAIQLQRSQKEQDGEEVRVDDNLVRNEQLTRGSKLCRLPAPCATSHMLQARSLDTDSASRE